MTRAAAFALFLLPLFPITITSRLQDSPRVRKEMQGSPAQIASAGRIAAAMSQESR